MKIYFVLFYVQNSEAHLQPFTVVAICVTNQLMTK